MIVGIGLDLVEVSRIRAVHIKFGSRFAKKILTPDELEMMPGERVSYLASRFAAKEAGVKALGTGFNFGITMHHLEIVKNSLGRPELSFSGPALERSREMQVQKIHLSLTHGRDTAAAVVILESFNQL